MEVRLRTGVSRTTRGYSTDSTLDIATVTPSDTASAELEKAIDWLSAFELAQLKKHMDKAEAMFPSGQEKP